MASKWPKTHNFSSKFCYRLSNLRVIGNTPALTWVSLSFQGIELQRVEIQRNLEDLNCQKNIKIPYMKCNNFQIFKD